MEEYINKYDSFEKKIVYDFPLTYGGIGDCIKYFMFILGKCMEKNIGLYYKKNNILIEKYLRLKYKKMYIDKIDSGYEYVCPTTFYSGYEYQQNSVPIKDVFYFSDEVIINSRILLPINITNYISIHLRLGDKYLETDKSFVLCKKDTRNYDEEIVFKTIENNSDKNIIFFCDNNSYKLKLKNLYNNIIITSCDIGHTSLTNTTDKQVLDGISEFYLMTNSEQIYSCSYSGFSIIASRFNNIPIILTYNINMKYN
jgi:hypothetical protein